MGQEQSSPSDFLRKAQLESDVVSWTLFRGQLKTYEEWEPREQILRSPVNTALSRKQLYILDVAYVLNFLGLQNTFEPETLLIEPAHCFSKEEVQTLIPLLTSDFDYSSLQSLGLDLLDPALVAQYHSSGAVEVGTGGSSASIAAKLCSPTSPALLFDPLYGMAICPSTGGWHQVCFALFGWYASRLCQERSQRRQYLSSPLDSLSEGVIISRARFTNCLPRRAREGLLERLVPEVVIQSPNELRSIVEKLNSALVSESSKMRLWFRGQTADHLVPDRTRLVELGMAKYCDIRDSSLVPSLYRQISRHHATPSDFMRLVRHLGDWALSAKMLLPEPYSILDNQGRPGYKPKEPPQDAVATCSMCVAGEAHLDIPGLKDIGPYSLWEIQDAEGRLIDSYIKLHHPSLQGSRIMLLLQHYGCPTSWIDVTSDSEIAAWFALHQLTKMSDGKYRADRVHPIGKQPDRWPTIYVFALDEQVHPVIDTARILADTRFLRPGRQRCGLLGGAGNLARNYAARYIALKLRLGPGYSRFPLQAVDTIFPPPDEDSGLRELLAAELHPMNDRLFRVYDVVSGEVS